MSNKFVMDSPIGRLAIHTHEGKLTQIDFAARNEVTRELADPLHREIAKQIRRYFVRPDTAFDLPLALVGTPFQLKVWRALQKIPASQTLSYGELATRLQSSARAVGNACRANPVPLVVPCHRVIARQGIGGFAGTTTGKPVARKRWLLAHEGAL